MDTLPYGLIDGTYTAAAQELAAHIELEYPSCSIDGNSDDSEEVFSKI